MLRRGFDSIAATWFAGLLALLPLALTAAVLAWVLNLIYEYFGPTSLIGRLFAALGYPFSSNPGLAYSFGTLVLVAAIYLLGVVVRMGLKGPIKNLTDRTLRHIPIVGGLYNLADRFVGLLDQTQGTDIGAMRPVWCRFGGDGVAVLALAPSAQPIDIDGRSYCAVLVPTAPVPFGGALLYVPSRVGVSGQHRSRQAYGGLCLDGNHAATRAGSAANTLGEKSGSTRNGGTS